MLVNIARKAQIFYTELLGMAYSKKKNTIHKEDTMGIQNIVRNNAVGGHFSRNSQVHNCGKGRHKIVHHNSHTKKVQGHQEKCTVKKGPETIRQFRVEPRTFENCPENLLISTVAALVAFGGVAAAQGNSA